MSVITITSKNFEEEVLRSEKTVLLDFWASWCGPCRRLSPIVDEVADERSGISVGKVRVDERRELAAELNMVAVPGRVVIKNGGIVSQSTGLISKSSLLSLLN